MAILDSDRTYCTSDTVLYDLTKLKDEDKDIEGGSVFNSNRIGEATIRGKLDEVSLTGENSIIGKWLQLQDANTGAQVSCCKIELYEDDNEAKE